MLPEDFLALYILLACFGFGVFGAGMVARKVWIVVLGVAMVGCFLTLGIIAVGPWLNQLYEPLPIITP